MTKKKNVANFIRGIGIGLVLLGIAKTRDSFVNKRTYKKDNGVIRNDFNQ